MSDENFSTFYARYCGDERGRETSFAAVQHYAMQKLLWYTMQVDSKNYNINTAEFQGARIRNNNFAVREFGPFWFIITASGNIYIENPSADRKTAIRDMSKYKLFARADRILSHNENAVVTKQGYIVFRDIHDTFYELQYEGKIDEAIDYALNALEVTREWR